MPVQTTERKTMTYFYFDIETIPSQEPWVRKSIKDNIKPPGNIKKQESIDKWMAEKSEAAIEEQYSKCALDGLTNHVIAIAHAQDDGTIYKTGIEHQDFEKEIISEFFDVVADLPSGTVFVGHNISGFDIKVLKQRAMLLGIKIPGRFPINAKPWDRVIYDTMIEWDSRNFVSMNKLAKAFGVKGKSDVDGSKVFSLWQMGEIDKIRDYAADDVRMLREIHEKMEFLT